MTQSQDLLIDVISATLPPLLTAMDGLGFIARHLHPPALNDVITAVGNIDTPLREALATFRSAAWPENLEHFRGRIETAAEEVLLAFDGLKEAIDDPNGIMRAYRALGHNATATEALYPLAKMFEPVSRFFLTGSDRDDKELLIRLGTADASREDVGVMHANNEKEMRGGFSIYVPEYYDPEKSYPVIVAMHGGSGHGKSFLWSWLREARGRGAILISPTSIRDTWSLAGPDQDTENLKRILGFVSEEWNIDDKHVLLTGMSDGGTFSYVSGLLPDAPYTHLAPFSASFHPMLIEFVEEARIKDLPIYLTHGALDWMFPVDIARAASKALAEAGANIIYREVEDLSHTYGREENPKIMDWFLID
jgi:phospholipase/carboxylesterase